MSDFERGPTSAESSTSVTVSNTTRTVNQGDPGDSTGPWFARDDFSSFLSTHSTLTANTNTAINLSTSVRMYRVTNWNQNARVLVSESTISGSSDGSASRVGVAPSADVPNSEVWPVTSTTINVLSTAAAEVTVEVFQA